MAEFLKLKKSNCKNCYKCIRHCPVKSIRFSAGQANIVGSECILCGQCFVVCPQNAKEITDSTEAVRVLLSGDAPVIASIAPSFVANYNGVGISALEDAMKKLGFTAAEETALGATLVKKEYERILREEHPNILISSCCHSVNLLIQKYFHNELKYLANVISPMQAHCLDIKRRYPGAKTVFVGPCVAKKDEAYQYAGITDAVLTFEELTRMLEGRSITIESKSDSSPESRARLFPTCGGILKTMACNQPGFTYLAVDGTENCIAALQDMENGGLTNCFIEMSACTGSCIGGPVMEKYHRSPIRDFVEITSYAGEKDFPVEALPDNSARRDFTYIENELPIPDESELTDILRQMGKTDPSQELNCGSCGYDTCHEKAVAIYQGKADLTMCLPFLKERAENFSDKIVSNTPNGIIVLNENLEVQQINRAACRMMNIRAASDILGEQVIRIMDPTYFMDVLAAKRDMLDVQAYLPEYNRYVDLTILYDKDYRVIICIMRDVTEQEEAKAKKEAVTKNTIEIADKVVDKQMRIVQEIASLLGETAAETKIALTKLKESISHE